MSMRLEAGEVVLGVDTHKEVHVAAVLDALGRQLAIAEFSSTDAGAEQLLTWGRRHGRVRAAGVEGTGSYGYQLTRRLQAAGVWVVEVSRPDRVRRRRRGKSDPVDADAAARAVLADDATAVPKDRGGPVGALRALMLARRSAVKARTQTMNQVHALLVSCDDSLRGTIGRLRGRHLAGACAALSPDDGTALALISLGRRWLTLHQEAATLDREIRKRVKTTAPQLLARHGVGIHTAAQLLITAGDNPDRLTHDAAFAALCGTSPVDASSGKTRRHRLNRGGDRSANTALWIIAHVRLVHDPRTRAYAARRTALGDSRKDILRRLQRYISRELYPIITASLATTTRP
jgi:transposase